MQFKVFSCMAVLTLVLSTVLVAQRVDRGTSELALEGAEVSIEYGRPKLEGRDMLGRASEGMTWRMGADAATTLDTTADLAFGELVVPAGKHTLRAQKSGPDSWTLIIQDVGEVPLKSARLEESVEQFTIELRPLEGNEAEFSMAWGHLKATAPFSVSPQSR